MNKIRAVIPSWRKKNYYDEEGYSSSSELSKTLSDSQFILRPSSNYYSFSEGTVSSAKSRDFEADSESNAPPKFRENSKNIPKMMPTLTSIRHFMTEHYDDLTTIEEMTTVDQEGTVDEEEEEEDTVVEDIEEYYEEYDEEEEDDDTTIDVPLTRKVGEFKNSSFRSFPFSYRIVESEMNKLFDMLQVDEQIPSGSGTQRQKKLSIKEPISKIYYHDPSKTETLDYNPNPKPKNKPKSSLTRIESIPKGILKKSTSFAIYEEIDGDHLEPMPVDIRPDLPDRKPIRAWDYCTTIERRKKLPSLHQSNSFASYFLRKINF